MKNRFSLKSIKEKASHLRRGASGDHATPEDIYEDGAQDLPDVEVDMEGNVSLLEFSRLQNEVLEVKEDKFRLEEERRSQEKELLRLANVERDLAKATQIIKKSKKKSEVAELVEENERLKNEIKADRINQVESVTFEAMTELQSPTPSGKPPKSLILEKLEAQINKLRLQNEAISNTISGHVKASDNVAGKAPDGEAADPTSPADSRMEEVLSGSDHDDEVPTPYFTPPKATDHSMGFGATELEEVREELESALVDREKLASECHRLNEQIAEHGEEVNVLRRDLESMRGQGEKDVELIMQKLAKREEIVRKLQMDFQSKCDEFLALSAQLDDERGKNSALMAEMEDLRTGQDSQTLSNRQMIEEMQLQMEEHFVTASVKEDEARELGKQLEVAKNTISQLESEKLALQQDGLEAGELNMALRSLSESLVKAETEVALRNEELRDLSSRNENLQTEVIRLQPIEEERNELTKKNSILTNSLEEERMQSEKVIQDLNEGNADTCRKLQLQMEELESAKARLQHLVEDQEQSIKALEVSLSEANQRADDNQHQLSEKLLELEQSQANEAQLRHSFELKEKKVLEESREEIATLKKELGDLHSQHEDVKQQMEDERLERSISDRKSNQMIQQLRKQLQKSAFGCVEDPPSLEESMAESQPPLPNKPQASTYADDQPEPSSEAPPQPQAEASSPLNTTVGTAGPGPKPREMAVEDNIVFLGKRLGELQLDNNRLKETVKFLEDSIHELQADVEMKRQVIEEFIRRDRIQRSKEAHSGQSGNTEQHKSHKGLFGKIGFSSGASKAQEQVEEQAHRVQQSLIEETISKNMDLQDQVNKLTKERDDLIEALKAPA